MNRNQSLATRRNDNYLTNLFEDYAKDFFSPLLSEYEGFNPKVEVKETDKNYIVCAELPGMKENDINLSLRENSLVIEGEKKSERKEEEKGYYRSEFEYGSFYRTIPFSTDVDDQNVTAKYKDGVLEVTLTKKNDGKTKTQKIPIQH